MFIPDELVMFGRSYEVKEVAPIHNLDGILGVAAYRDASIYLDPTMDPALALKTMWHEAIHIAQQEVLGEMDESQARWMSLFIHNFLVSNPEVVSRYLEGQGWPTNEQK